MGGALYFAPAASPQPPMVKVSSPSVVTGEPAGILLHNSGARHPEKERREQRGGGGTLALFIRHWITGSQTQSTHTYTHTQPSVGTGGGDEKVIQCMKFNIFQDEHENS